MNESCPVCESTNLEMRGTYRGVHALFTGLQRAHCRACGMAFADPMPSKTLLDEYNANYFSSAHGGKSLDPVAAAFFSGIARLRMNYFELYLRKQNISVSNLLELGPGTGFFARSWRECYPSAAYFAVETDSSCHSSLTDAGVTVVDARDMTLPILDAVVMSHVLEHVPEPVDFLRDATRNLRKGGAIFIEVPCRDWEHKSIDEPHILFFDKGPMHQLLSQLGFSHIQLSYHGQEIDRLRSASVLDGKFMAIRSKLLALGLVAPFSSMRAGMEILSDPLERAAVAPFDAHLETSEPAWWLRAVALKN